jgi:uncharacterized protein (DUF427 family)
VILGGIEICETRTSLRMLETGHAPTYYLPRSAFLEDSLRSARGISFCEWKGRAAYLDVIGGGKSPARGAWCYPHPHARYAAIHDHVGIYAAAMDECLVDGERVVPQPGGFYGGWITSTVAGPFKGGPATDGW